jgi:hypothetical protein
MQLLLFKKLEVNQVFVSSHFWLFIKTHNSSTSRFVQDKHYILLTTLTLNEIKVVLKYSVEKAFAFNKFLVINKIAIRL